MDDARIAVETGVDGVYVLKASIYSIVAKTNEITIGMWS